MDKILRMLGLDSPQRRRQRRMERELVRIHAARRITDSVLNSVAPTTFMMHRTNQITERLREIVGQQG